METLCCQPCNLILYPSLSTVWLDPEVFPFFFVNGAAALVGVRCRNARVFKNRIICLHSLLKTKSWCIIAGNLSKNLSLDIQLLDRTFIAATSVSCIPGSASLTWFKPVGGLCMLKPFCAKWRIFFRDVFIYSFFNLLFLSQVIYTTAGGALANLLHKMTDDEDLLFITVLASGDPVEPSWTQLNSNWQSPLVSVSFQLLARSWTKVNWFGQHWVIAMWRSAWRASHVRSWCEAHWGGRLPDIQEFLMWVFMHIFPVHQWILFLYSRSWSSFSSPSLMKSPKVECLVLKVPHQDEDFKDFLLVFKPRTLLTLVSVKSPASFGVFTRGS